jgi:hypothetical protein
MIRRFLPLLPLLALISCSTSGNNSSSAASSGYKPLSQRVNETAGYTRDAEGNWKTNSNQRSSFESKRDAANVKGTYQKKDFKASTYAERPVWGKEEFSRQSYSGQTDGSRFQQSSKLQGKTSRDSGTTARVPDPYRTGSYATSTANEAGSSRLDRPSDAETDSRRRVFTPPAIIDWQAQRQMSVETSRSLLGR